MHFHLNSPLCLRRTMAMAMTPLPPYSTARNRSGGRHNRGTASKYKQQKNNNPMRTHKVPRSCAALRLWSGYNLSVVPPEL